MKRYTIKFREHDQDNLNFIPFKAGDRMPEYLDYDEVLEYSIARGEISGPEDIKCLCDGSNKVEPYFTSNTPAYECEVAVENDLGQTFRAKKTVYEAF